MKQMHFPENASASGPTDAKEANAFSENKQIQFPIPTFVSEVLREMSPSLKSSQPKLRNVQRALCFELLFGK